MIVKAYKEIASEILRRPESLQRELARIVAKTTLDLEKSIKQRIASPKHGRTYRRGALTRRASRNTRALGLRERTSPTGKQPRAIIGSRLHRASAPGEAPASDKGTLTNSIRSKTSGTHGAVTASARHAPILEFVKHRAVFLPELERARPAFERDVLVAMWELI